MVTLKDKLEFPEESVRQARDIAAKYKRRNGSKDDWARALHEGYFYRISYGFSESIKTGNCGRHLHEIRKEADCFTLAGVMYLIARETGLQPKMYSAFGMVDVREGEDPNEKVPYEHSFITCVVNKGGEHIIDPFMGTFGRAKFLRGENVIEIYDPKIKCLTMRAYSALNQLSEQEYLRKLEENRSPKGGRIALAGGQRIKGANNHRVYVSFNPETSQLTSSIRYGRTLFMAEPLNTSIITDLVTDVAENGGFDFEKGTFYFYNAALAGWLEHQRQHVPLVYSVKDAKKIWGIWEEIIRKRGRVARIGRMMNHKMVEMVLESGFKDDFHLKAGSLAAKIARPDTIRQIHIAQSRAIDNFVPRCRKDEISYKFLLRAAHRVREQDKHKSDTNLLGLMFSEEERVALLEEGLKNYKIVIRHSNNVLVKDAKIRARLRKGTRYRADRMINDWSERARRELRYFENMASTRSRIKFNFDYIADVTLFNRRFDLENMPVEALEQGLTEEDIKRAAQERLFYRLLSAFLDREALFLASYKPGLKKILDMGERS